MPVLETGGWYDLKVHEQVADFVRVRTQAGSEQAREESRLVIGPWDHINLTGQYPDRYFGLLAAGDLGPSHVEFFDQHLKGTPPATPAPRVRIFVMGIDQWRDETDWPLPDTQYTDYHLGQRRLGQHPRRRRHPHTRRPDDRGQRRVPLRPPRPGAHRRRRAAAGPARLRSARWTSA